ncbi:MAG TPA: hypothetical protein VM925_20585 [Labilithrix sp.]|jgi:DNA-binding beta-propeller fold protein YncE|nr:hypothetical protein [Labilithrix sp.]
MIRTTFSGVGAAMLFLLAASCSTSAASEETSADAELVSSIDVRPFTTIGTGRPGAEENDINTPDGVVFDANGSLLLTDAKNHRVQVWDVRTTRRLGQFGSPEIFHGDIVDLAVSPRSGQLVVTDESAHVAYAFDPPSPDDAGELALTNYRFTGKDMFAEYDLKKVGGVTFDSKGRIYTVDARKNLVSRYDAEGNPDPTFQFVEKGSVAFLRGCEGIAVDEKRGNLYVASEADSVVRVFDLEDGSYKQQMIGRRSDSARAGTPVGKSVFQAAVEGLWIIDDYLLASDESDGGTGRVLIFDLNEPSVFDHDADDYARLQQANERSGYVGSFGSFCSPDSVAAFTDADGESYVAVADQCHYQVPVYKWSDIQRAGRFGRQ